MQPLVIASPLKRYFICRIKLLIPEETLLYRNVFVVQEKKWE